MSLNLQTVCKAGFDTDESRRLRTRLRRGQACRVTLAGGEVLLMIPGKAFGKDQENSLTLCGSAGAFYEWRGEPIDEYVLMGAGWPITKAFAILEAMCYILSSPRRDKNRWHSTAKTTK